MLALGSLVVASAGLAVIAVFPIVDIVAIPASGAAAAGAASIIQGVRYHNVYVKALRKLTEARSSLEHILSNLSNRKRVLENLQEDFRRINDKCCAVSTDFEDERKIRFTRADTVQIKFHEIQSIILEGICRVRDAHKEQNDYFATYSKEGSRSLNAGIDSKMVASESL